MDDKLRLLSERVFWPGRYHEAPEALLQVPSMIWLQEKLLLHWIAKEYYRGHGAIVDLGAFQGASTVYFADGLTKNPHISEGITIQSYDLFRLGPYEEKAYFKDKGLTPPPEGRTRHLFDQNTQAYKKWIEVHEGDVLDERWDRGAIEILFVDIAKSATTNDHVIRTFFPNLILGESLVIQQDYLWKSGPWIHVSMEKLHGHFRRIVDTDIDSVVFQYVKPISEKDIEAACFANIAEHERVELMDRAISREEPGQKRDYLVQAKTQLTGGGVMNIGMHYHSL